MDTSWIISFGPVLAPWATFFAVVLAIYAFYILRNYRRLQVYRRLQGISDSVPSAQLKSDFHKEQGFQIRVLKPAGGLILPPDDWRRSAIKKRLTMAGYRNPAAIYIFLGAKLFAAAVLTFLVFAAYVVTGNSYLILSLQAIFFLVSAAVIGFILPDLEIGQVIRRRRVSFEEGYPDALDMLVVCVEAGLGLDAAIDRVAKEMRLSHPDLSIELSLISLEVRAGKSRREALENLAERTAVDQVKSLVTLLVQAERFGTSVATALREYADEMRVERIQRAREKAAKLPVKLIFPVVLFIFPALFLVILGPAFIQIATVMGDFF